jgi:iron complex outermembrane receptor protein
MPRSLLVPRLVAFTWWAVAWPVCQASDAPKRLEPIEIVGSHLKRVEDEGPVPVTVIRRDEIAASGAERVGDLLFAHPLAGSGGFDDRSTGFGPSFGSAGLSLRGLGAPATLVLLNGRRLASYGVVLENDSSYVDLNSIPLAAVERIEILRDGASAIYGADAIGGVVNIVLRSDFRGAEGSVRLGGATQGDSWRRGARLGFGAGDLGSDGWNAFALVDASRNDATRYTDRAFSRTGDQRRRGGSDRRSPISLPPNYVVLDPAGDVLAGPRSAPGCPPERQSPALIGNDITCRFEISPYTDLLPASRRIGLLAVVSAAPDATTRLFAELVASRGETALRQAPATVRSFVPRGTPGAVVDGEPLDGDAVFNWRVPGAQRRSVSTLDFTSAAVGAEGLHAGWDTQVALGGSRIATRAQLFNQVRGSLIREAVRSGRLAPLQGVIDEDVVAGALVDALNRYRGGSTYLMAKASRDLAELANGPLALALGAESRRESWSTDLDPLTLLGDNGSSSNLGVENARAARRVSAAFVELNWPAARGLEFQIAARHDRYSDYGSSTSPKLALRWQPRAGVLLRASAARGFLPPSLVQVNKPPTSFGDEYIDYGRCPNPNPDDIDLNCLASFLHVQAGTSGVRAERSRQHNVGVVFEPVPGSSVALDVWRISHLDKIAFGDRYILDNEARFPGRIVREPPTADDLEAGRPGRIVELRDTYINLARRDVRGVDLEWRTRLPARAWGQLGLHGLVTTMQRFDEQLAPGLPARALLGEEGRARTRARFGADWTRGAWSAGAALNHVGGYRYAVFPAGVRNAASSTTADFHAGWSRAEDSLKFVLRNVTDRDPPMIDRAEGFDSAVHDPIGRTWLFSWTRRF